MAPSSSQANKARPVTVSLPASLLSELDRLVEETPFAGRSVAVQAAVTQFVAEQRASRSSKQQAVVAVCFDKSDERRVATVKHEYGEIIRSMMHAHLRGNDCVEVFVVDGASARVASFYSALSALKGIHLVRHTVIPGHEGLL
jgi:metal-responsive CopG/Arc/MetJ family transcriptional regulator